ncbi:MAG: hypothetical protein CFH10_00487 [Alphaproteobacteria bacterium MarineAlpha4_Bin2]|nr:MAG: hypothetical protein CFH10_00487 [Alphaproteobacteria bacterium MarineAlpha4_Bin2]
MSQFSAPHASSPKGLDNLAQEVREAGFAFYPSKEMGALVSQATTLRHWQSFASSWDKLGLDLYMADGGRYRRRRFAAFRITREDIKRKAHQPHYQSRDYNPLNGDIERWFEPVLPEVASHPVLMDLMGTCRRVFEAVGEPTRSTPWHAEMHQFRIEANKGFVGLPTPEGMHRDGVDWVCVILVKRENMKSGITEIHDGDRNVTSRFRLMEPFDTVFLDDTRVRHGVTPIAPLNPARNSHRDVLVLTFRSAVK